MSDASDINPYAPPKSDVDAPARRVVSARHHDGDIQQALAMLRQHVADAAWVDHDRRIAGPRIRPHGWVSALICVAAIGGAVVTTQIGGDMAVALAINGIIAMVAFIMALAFLIMDVSLVRRDRASTPEATVKAFFKSISAGRFGYAWATLAPSARAQTVPTPDLGPIQVVQGDFSLETEKGMKDYTAAFARPGKGTMRTMAAKKVLVRAIDGDVAKIDVELAFQSWPQWVSIVMAIGAIIFRPLIIVGVVLFFVMRKKHEVRCTKTMLRAPNGVWYVFAGDLVEPLET